jgi:hypothetical protein
LLQGRRVTSNKQAGLKSNVKGIATRTAQKEVMQTYHIQLPTTPSTVAEDAPMLTQKSLQEEGVEVRFQDGMIETVDSNDEYSNVGSFKSEDERELEDYCKKIEQEDIVEEEGKLDVETPNTTVLAAIPEASS